MSKHWTRICITLIPLLLVLLHACGFVRSNMLEQLDHFIYDTKLRATMPRSLDSRIVIVDIDEKSLAEAGRWPWGRNKLSQLTEELFNQQKIAALGFDVVFAEPDDSSGLRQLQLLAQNELRDQSGFVGRLGQLQSSLDYDAQFAQSLSQRPVVLGYYLTSDRQGRTSGQLPEPVMAASSVQGRVPRVTSWDGYGANLPLFVQAAPQAGYFNSITESDGVVRSLPLIAEHKGLYYESLSLALFRLLLGKPALEPGFPKDRFFARQAQGLESLVLRQKDMTLAIPVDARAATLVPFRGPGGPSGGSFRYISASDLLAKRVPPGQLAGKIVLVGTTAPGLLDLRVTPVGETYPGVEAHANMISGLLDGKVNVVPDYALGLDVVVLLIAGLVLAFALPRLSALRAVGLSVAVLLGIMALNFGLHWAAGLVFPLAAALVMVIMSFALNMSYGYFVESRSKRELAHLFGTYVPPELVDEMVKDPDSYSMAATSKELTVLFCDMRGFTKMSESMDPTQLQQLLNHVFSRLTHIIRAHRGTIDKYMGDCVMAFWGAPVALPNHAELACRAALDMAREIRLINQELRAKGLPEIGVGIGINSGAMAVGDMGSDIRKSYTVIGDAVNLASRLEGLSKVYKVDIVASAATRDAAPNYCWQELDKVRVKGKDTPVSIYWPLGPATQVSPDLSQELSQWQAALKAYRQQNWDACDVHLLNASRINAKKFLYGLYQERVVSMRHLPHDPAWDGTTHFDYK